VLTDRGRFALALGGGTYLAGWAFGSEALYPVAVGLVLSVVAATLWVRLAARPVSLRRSVIGGDHVAGDDILIRLEVQVDGRFVPGSLGVVERIERIGRRDVLLTKQEGRLMGEYVLDAVPRGRYPIGSAEAVVEDPFSLERREIDLETPGALLVYPRLVELDTLFSETGSRAQDGRRLLLRRPSGFDLHSVREYEQGESLRRVHWPSTAKRGQLMVKDLEDSPRDEALVLLDADAATVVGIPPESSFETAVSAAGSILRAHAGRGRRAALVVNGAEARYQPVHSLEGDWGLALELLAAVEPDGRTPVAGLLVEGSGHASKALEVCVVTAALSPRLTERLLQRSVTRRGTSVVYVDAASYAGLAAPAGRPGPDVRGQIARLEHAGIAVCVLSHGDDLAARLGSAAFQKELVG
jgi:uncharacterized protein (DUF58 family)